MQPVPWSHRSPEAFKGQVRHVSAPDAGPEQAPRQAFHQWLGLGGERQRQDLTHSDTLSEPPPRLLAGPRDALLWSLHWLHSSHSSSPGHCLLFIQHTFPPSGLWYRMVYKGARGKVSISLKERGQQTTGLTGQSRGHLKGCVCRQKSCANTAVGEGQPLEKTAVSILSGLIWLGMRCCKKMGVGHEAGVADGAPNNSHTEEPGFQSKGLGEPLKNNRENLTNSRTMGWVVPLKGNDQLKERMKRSDP